MGVLGNRPQYFTDFSERKFPQSKLFSLASLQKIEVSHQSSQRHFYATLSNIRKFSRIHPSQRSLHNFVLCGTSQVNWPVFVCCLLMICLRDLSDVMTTKAASSPVTITINYRIIYKADECSLLRLI